MVMGRVVGMGTCSTRQQSAMGMGATGAGHIDAHSAVAGGGCRCGEPHGDTGGPATGKVVFVAADYLANRPGDICGADAHAMDRIDLA